MTTEEYLEIFEKLGYEIITTKNATWVTIQNYIHSFPSLNIFYPEDNDFNELFKKKYKIILFTTKLNFTNTYEYAFIGNNYSIETFKSKIRNQIRKGLKSCIIKDADLKSLQEDGFMINISTLKRHNRTVDYLNNKSKWINYTNCLYNKKDIFIKAAYFENKIIGYVIFVKLNEQYLIQHPFINIEYSSFCPMNAILFSFINDIISKEGKINISYGLASYLDKPELDHFKEGMQFQAIPSTRIIAISRTYKIIFNKIVYLFLVSLKRFKLVPVTLVDKYRIMLESKKEFDFYKKAMKNK